VFTSHLDLDLLASFPFARRRVQVLHFYAWSEEAVHDSRLEQHRVRFMSIYYYIPDNTIRVYEPRINNSQLYQVRA
jgi:hypothetical protein